MIKTIILPKLIKYWEVAVISWRSRMAYITDIVGEVPLIVLHLWILTHLYTITYDSTGVQTIEELTVPMTIWILMIITCFSTAMYPTVSLLPTHLANIAHASRRKRLCVSAGSFIRINIGDLCRISNPDLTNVSSMNAFERLT